ncbi:hypothetical protein [Guptibacillus hwajinpoensis]|uniref:hypothetical protein n=1 Tax=Guptibacillus hwajinpoensis TaxID=208199 RepID=UPI001CFCEE65|nr:hypothetical protein [Pseudalkalibacillus hwajinpoensis]WLR59851.1 hypothetical protein LC071_00065 [Pseudalkalibacillus hwajinpoensis]
MPYNKDKQQSFQAAQQGYEQAVDAKKEVVVSSSGYGKDLKHLHQEVGEAKEQIESALMSATEHQRAQLLQFQQDLQSIEAEMNQE